MHGPTLRLSAGFPAVSPELRGDVLELQRALVHAGYRVRLDGRFGAYTEAAVRAFQRRHGLRDDGVAGPATRRLLAARRESAPAACAPPPPPPVPLPGAAAAGDVLLPVRWVGQFDVSVPGHGMTACFRACRTMAAAVGVVVPDSTEQRIQVATGEDADGRVTTASDGVAAARAYLDSELAAGRPVAVGVSHARANRNRDGITDHFVLVIGRSGSDRAATYLYHDPATHFERKGARHGLRIDPGTGNLVHDGSLAEGEVVSRHYEVSMVVRNTPSR